MKNLISKKDIDTLRDIAANQLEPLSKMEYHICRNYSEIPPEEAKVIAKDILDQVAGELGFQTKYNKICVE